MSILVELLYDVGLLSEENCDTTVQHILQVYKQVIRLKKITGCPSVYLYVLRLFVCFYRWISLTAAGLTWFFFSVRLIIGPGKDYNYI